MDFMDYMMRVNEFGELASKQDVDGKSIMCRAVYDDACTYCELHWNCPYITPHSNESED